MCVDIPKIIQMFKNRRQLVALELMKIPGYIKPLSVEPLSVTEITADNVIDEVIMPLAEYDKKTR